MQEISWAIEPSVLIRLFLSVLLGGVIGWEREIHGRPAGFRTHVMVCFGATMLIVSSELYGGNGRGIGIFDPDRMAAGIITGIGFLGAGAILREGNIVRGLTTAGCIWFIAGLGIVVGKSLYVLAIEATVLALVALVLFRFAEAKASTVYYQDLTMRVTMQDYKDIKANCEELFRKNKVKVSERRFVVNNSRNEVQIKYALQVRKGQEREELIFELSKLPGTLEVSL